MTPMKTPIELPDERSRRAMRDEKRAADVHKLYLATLLVILLLFGLIPVMSPEWVDAYVIASLVIPAVICSLVEKYRDRFIPRWRMEP
jgi:hypothetical protein